MGGEGIELVVGDDLWLSLQPHLVDPLCLGSPESRLGWQPGARRDGREIAQSIRQIGVVFGIAGIKIIHSFPRFGRAFRKAHTGTDNNGSLYDNKRSPERELNPTN